MRLLLVSAVVGLLAQGKLELKPIFKKFDRVVVACTVQTEIKSSDGRDSKYKLELEVEAEVEKGEGDRAVFHCEVASAKLSGRVNGKAADGDWKKGGEAKLGGFEKALGKGWKLTLDGKKGFSMGDDAVELGDALPLFNPGVFAGFSVPLPYGPAAAGEKWEVKDQTFPHFYGFTVKFAAQLNQVKDGTARISASLAYAKPQTEVPIEGAVNVKGEGDASLDYDVKSGRPLRGATSLRLTSAQGGLRREVSQVIEFEVKK
jgi:hypothetical protein